MNINYIDGNCCLLSVNMVEFDMQSEYRVAWVQSQIRIGQVEKKKCRKSDIRLPALMPIRSWKLLVYYLPL